jgi:hypothetical protein
MPSVQTGRDSRKIDKFTSKETITVIRRIPRKDCNAFRPSLGDSPLEDRLVLNAAATVAVQALTVPITPPPAPAPVSPAMAVAQVHRALRQQARSLATDVRTAINDRVTALYANGKPTTQQIADFNAEVMGIANAAALRLSGQAALLPASSSRLIPGIQNALLGSGSNSLISRIQSLATSTLTGASASTLQAAVTRQVNATLQVANARFGNYFTTTSLNRLSVDQSGNRIPLRQFMGNQLLGQVGNMLGVFAQNFPTVSTAALFPNGTTDVNGLPITASQAALSAFNLQASNALQTAAFQLGNGLSIFSGASRAASQLQPILFGSGVGSTSLASSLQNFQFGSTGFNSAVSNAFNSSFQSIGGVLNPFLGLQAQSIMTLPTSGFTSLFGSNFTGSNFASGFNNGFVASPSSGFIGFGQAPAAFNSNFGTSFNTLASGLNANFGFGSA